MISRLYATPQLLLILTVAMWAGNAIAGQLAVGNVQPMTLVLLRWIIVVAIMWPIAGRQMRAHWPEIREKFGIVVFMSLAGFTGFNALFYIASIHTSGLNIGILQGSMPVIVMIGAFLVYGEKIKGLRVLGVALTLVGVGMVASRGELSVLLTLAFNAGDLIMMAAILTYCAYTLAIPSRPQIPGIALFTLFSVIAMVAAVPLAAWEVMQPAYQPPTLKGWAITLFVAIFPSCLAQIFFLRATDLIGPNGAIIYTNLVPIFTAVLAVLILDETFALYHAAALALVIGGILITQRSGA